MSRNGTLENVFCVLSLLCAPTETTLLDCMNSNRFFIMSGTITEQSRHAYNIYHYPTERQTTPLETDLLVKLRGNVW
ncbi:hypothetical protein J6590_003387 [Homalodisca vitripennis]|nr:hypothetical protein J6590_003387 [Homalodisca vitripennis]